MSEFNTYEVTFILDQRGEYIDWIEEVLLSGLREGEQIIHLDIYKIPEYELTEH
jgi:hypothetical protein